MHYYGLVARPFAKLFYFPTDFWTLAANYRFILQVVVLSSIVL